MCNLESYRSIRVFSTLSGIVVLLALPMAIGSQHQSQQETNTERDRKSSYVTLSVLLTRGIIPACSVEFSRD